MLFIACPLVREETEQAFKTLTEATLDPPTVPKQTFNQGEGIRQGDGGRIISKCGENEKQKNHSTDWKIGEKQWKIKPSENVPVVKWQWQKRGQDWGAVRKCSAWLQSSGVTQLRLEVCLWTGLNCNKWMYLLALNLQWSLFRGRQELRWKTVAWDTPACLAPDSGGTCF